MPLSYPALPAKGLVVQCAGCRSVLGDSTDFVCAMDCPEDGARCLCLRGVSQASVDRISHTTLASTSGRASSAASSSGGGSSRSTHFTVCCSTCGAAVGRLYTELPPELEPARHLFCLESERCLSYELGSAEVRAAGEAGRAQARQPQQLDGAAAGATGADASLIDLLVQRIEQLEASLCSVQGMQVLHDAQLRLLPNYQAGEEAADM